MSFCFVETNDDYQKADGKGIILGQKAIHHPAVRQLTENNAYSLIWHFIETLEDKKGNNFCESRGIIYYGMDVLFFIVSVEDNFIKENIYDSLISEYWDDCLRVGIVIGKDNFFGVKDYQRLVHATDLYVFLDDDESLLRNLTAMVSITMMPALHGVINLKFDEMRCFLRKKGRGHLGVITIPMEPTLSKSEIINSAEKQIQKQLPGEIIEYSGTVLVCFYDNNIPYMFNHCTSLLEVLPVKEDVGIIWNLLPLPLMGTEKEITMVVLICG
ncbi:hypothetical protein SAMN02746065_11024 [Desulfocicer vacuolatum DSM 3385]|uniref:Uncharacterized protein n=1 Tax=Desulfocicer vacuolatum DSM 3385 TaxID=1121400 RepID=A0A1W2BZT7_9BACT|nr:hypothetical protein [Desulfocicer vacuolatum]SMC78264.1 hypothetical protein SAMN02746065_11024 [Desulfocicer vacuolatum DSM 3385]